MFMLQIFKSCSKTGFGLGSIAAVLVVGSQAFAPTVVLAAAGGSSVGFVGGLESVAGFAELVPGVAETAVAVADFAMAVAEFAVESELIE